MSALNDLRLFRVYEPHELGADGYPLVWHEHPDSATMPPCSENTHELRSGEWYHRDHSRCAAWNDEEPVKRGVKHLVREDAGHRCVRCGHPYRKGESPRGEWSRCDERCGHGGPIRSRKAGGEWREWPLGESPSVGWDNVPDAVKADEEVEAQWRILTVHHLNGRKHDLRWWNLIAVCQRCHLWLQGTVIMERVYPWEHDHYFKPHAAGWYAYCYLGETLTKIQTMQRLEDLLALERVV